MYSMTTYSTTFLKEIEELLLSQRQKIEDELNRFATRKSGTDFTSEFPDYGSKEDENAEEVATYETNLRLEETLESELRDIATALDKIKKGTYGICKYCGKTIAEDRLRARPTSGSCVECKKTITQEL